MIQQSAGIYFLRSTTRHRKGLWPQWSWPTWEYDCNGFSSSEICGY